jgi:hypothetical protein
MPDLTATAQSQGALAGVQYSGPNGHFFFDTLNGDLWQYEDRGDNKHPDRWVWEYWGKVPWLGQPLVGGSIGAPA